jgi:hypothetical protein
MDTETEQRFISLERQISILRGDAAIKERLATVEGELHTGFATMNERFDAIMALLGGNQPKPPEQ